ncbi:MAG: NUDIX domain-containing protein, partial [Nanoarchaeota archaeon]|nr:NUDIX domain-containing protein [Nanoarchaeota archaeon]
ARREILEEVGIDVDNLNFLKIKKVKTTYNSVTNNEIAYIYLVKCDLEETKFKIQKEELQCVKWFDVDFILKDIMENPDKYIPSAPQWKDVLNKVKGMK